MKKDFKDMSYAELYSLRCAAKSICDDLSEMATTYSVVHGNKQFQDLPDDMQQLISERQEFYGYIQTLNDVLKNKIREEFKND